MRQFARVKRTTVEKAAAYARVVWIKYRPDLYLIAFAILAIFITGVL